MNRFIWLFWLVEVSIGVRKVLLKFSVVSGSVFWCSVSIVVIVVIVVSSVKVRLLGSSL